MLVFTQWIGLILVYGINVYTFMLFAYILVGWFIQNRYAAWYVFLGELCEPAIRFTQRITRGRLVAGNMDLSPILLFFGLTLLARIITIIFGIT